MGVLVCAGIRKCIYFENRLTHRHRKMQISKMSIINNASNGWRGIQCSYWSNGNFYFLVFLSLHNVAPTWAQTFALKGCWKALWEMLGATRLTLCLTYRITHRRYWALLQVFQEWNSLFKSSSQPLTPVYSCSLWQHSLMSEKMFKYPRAF